LGVKEHVASAFIGISLRFERFFPQIIKFFMNKKLRGYKEKGWISNYKIQARRKGKYHYSFIVDLSLGINRGGEEHGRGEEGTSKDHY